MSTHISVHSSISESKEVTLTAQKHREQILQILQGRVQTQMHHETNSTSEKTMKLQEMSSPDLCHRTVHCMLVVSHSNNKEELGLYNLPPRNVIKGCM